MTSDKSVLKCRGDRIVDGEGKEVILRGACLGGYLLQENFTNGFPGHEKAYRKAMLDVLGQERYDHFWNKFFEYFYAEADAKYFASLGLNLIRLAINYRHLNDDMEPAVIKQEGFKWIDRVIQLNAAEGIYTVIDLHAAPGGQNFDWHADHNLPDALLWEYKDFQDRTVRIWEAIAERYRGNPWVAGYNLINEPTDNSPGATRLLTFYDRLAKAVRAIDPDHILCFDGNTFGADFSAFEAANFNFDNSIFSCHDYATYGFPGGPIYNGTNEDKMKLRKGSPVWNGEFGIVYATPETDGQDWQRVNDERYACLRDQLKLYSEDRISWTIWLYKDIGVQGMVHSREDSLWNRTFADSIAKKRKHALDFWGTDYSATEKRFEGALEFLKEEFPEALPSYPPWWSLRQHLFRRVLYTWISDNLCVEFVQPMKEMTMDELDELAASFKFENCIARTQLIDLLRS